MCPGCGGWKYAAEHSIATVAYPASPRTVVNGNQTGVSTEELMHGLKEQHEVDYVLLAGYLKVFLTAAMCSPMCLRYASILPHPHVPEICAFCHHSARIIQGGAWV